MQTNKNLLSQQFVKILLNKFLIVALLSKELKDIVKGDKM